MTTEIELLPFTRARLSEMTSHRYHSEKTTTLVSLAGAAVSVLKSYGITAEAQHGEVSIWPPQENENDDPRDYPPARFDLRQMRDNPREWNLQFDHGLRQWFGPTEMVAGELRRTPAIDTLVHQLLDRAKL